MSVPVRALNRRELLSLKKVINFELSEYPSSPYIALYIPRKQAIKILGMVLVAEARMDAKLNKS